MEAPSAALLHQPLRLSNTSQSLETCVPMIWMLKALVAASVLGKLVALELLVSLLLYKAL